ncbi:MAG: GxxExxY protein [Bacteroidales bacterium]|nr:GxxExxY protein [Bacteroidales bacterium]
MEVHKKLGAGFLEAVYQEALEKEIIKKEIPYNKQVKKLELYYDNKKMKKYYVADFICYDKIILELKATTIITPPMKQQLMNYLKATGMRLGILINFGEKSLNYARVLNSSATN